MSEENKFPVPKWLEELQQKSWEPEILLSGIVLYGMFKVPDLLDSFLAYFKLNIFGNSQDIDNLVSLFKMGIYWLIGGLVLHLICRGIWIGMVGLSYTFPKGIDKSRLNYQDRFMDKVDKIPSYEKIVIRLEKICSSLFSVSFMLFMSLIGGYLFFFILIIVPFFLSYIYLDLGFSGPMFDAFQIYVIFIISIGFLGLGDFLTLGFFRRYRWFAKLYWPLHWVISGLTLSRYYRPIYYGMVSHFNKWAFALLLVTFVVVSIMGASTNTSNFYSGDAFSKLELWENAGNDIAFSGYYEDQNVNRASIRAHIPSDIINGDVLRVFVVAHINREDEMLETTSLDSLIKLYPDSSEVALKMGVVRNYLKIYMDDVEVKENDWRFHYHTGNKQRGYLAYVDIRHLNEGLHTLSIRGPDETASWAIANIPFYRDVQMVQQNTSSSSQPTQEEPSDFQPKPFGIRE